MKAYVLQDGQYAITITTSSKATFCPCKKEKTLCTISNPFDETPSATSSFTFPNHWQTAIYPIDNMFRDECSMRNHEGVCLSIGKKRKYLINALNDDSCTPSELVKTVLQAMRIIDSKKRGEQQTKEPSLPPYETAIQQGKAAIRQQVK